eukprot:TRINITY_DN3517_c0_g1_i1.p1 TRINITY_DN3517_c0_g1~~TRINITY_DN3517_c0_g1_i1.p1  ORF type:complete len:489 (+),score=90.90 TRINITY_DN3517_c0_g1_i1:214-1680(+)
MVSSPSKRLFIFAVFLGLVYFYTFLNYSYKQRPHDDFNTVYPDDHKHFKDSTRAKTLLNPDNSPQDEVIVVLGHTLHPDGMPSRIMKDRVVVASQIYHQLRSNYHHPFIIFSGKGKSANSEYTEAAAMHEIALCKDVKEDDILVDGKSSNTAENALFTSKLLIEKGILEATIVTSDYHILRSQYIFQTVFPSNVTLYFVASQTDEGTRTEKLGRERALFKNAQEDLENLHLLNEEEVFGYHPIRNFPRWRMIEREIENDMKTGENFNVQNEQSLAVVDYGSNYGYFSLSMAKKLGKGVVISVEGEAYAEYDGAAKYHKSKMEEMQVSNNVLCKTKVYPSAFQKLKELDQVFRYQLCLSVFHWFKMPTRDDFEVALANHLSNAYTTFIELPEAMVYQGNEGQHAWKQTNLWFNKRDEVTIIKEVAEKYDLGKVTIKILGALMHDNETVRKVIRVNVEKNKNKPKVDVDKVLEIYGCAGETNSYRFDGKS